MAVPDTSINYLPSILLKCVRAAVIFGRAKHFNYLLRILLKCVRAAVIFGRDKHFNYLLRILLSVLERQQ